MLHVMKSPLEAILWEDSMTKETEDFTLELPDKEWKRLEREVARRARGREWDLRFGEPIEELVSVPAFITDPKTGIKYSIRLVVEFIPQPRKH
jgi:hypothetical protein